MTLLSDKDLILKIQKAFAPLRCAVKIAPYRKTLSFRVFGPHDEPIVQMMRLSMAEAMNEPFLTSTLSSVRAIVEEKGFSLGPWL